MVLKKFDVFIIVPMLGLVFLMIFGGCAAVEPYVTVQHLEIFDENEAVITVHNTTSKTLKVVLKCVGSAYTTEEYIEIAPHADWRRLSPILNQYGHAEPCWLEKR